MADDEIDMADVDMQDKDAAEEEHMMYGHGTHKVMYITRGLPALNGIQAL
jgi:hypothetical protein